MPSFDSDDGVWLPKTERAVYYDKDGNPHIYEGPCRAATRMLKEAGEDHLGMPFWENSDIIERAHDKNMTIEQFTKQKLYPAEQRKANFKKRHAEKTNHKLPTRKPAKKQTETGGKNTAGNEGHMYGDFGGQHSGDAMSDAMKTVK